MNRTLLAFMLALSSVASAQVQHPYNPDGNFDGQIGASDILDILVLYGNDFALGTFQSDSSSAILYVGEMTFWNCKSNCNGLPGNWKVLDDYLVGTYSETLVDLEPIWLSSSITRAEDLQIAALLEWPDWSDGEIIVSPVDRYNVHACVCQTRVNPLLEDIDPCAGLEDECGICQGEGAIYECGCFDIPEGDCDCDGNQLDALGVCGGDCPLDADGDGVCDPVCGNGVVEGNEMCDDGNDNPDDGCHGCQEVWQCGDSLEYWGYFYSTVLTADEKCWFAENLRTEKFQSGDQIEVFIDEGQSISGLSWGQLAGSGSTMFNASPALAINSTHSYVPIGSPDIYMYSFASVVNSSGLCPAGWHVPVKEEFEGLYDAYNGPQNAALSLKAPDIDGCGTIQFQPSGLDIDSRLFMYRYGYGSPFGYASSRSALWTSTVESESGLLFPTQAYIAWIDMCGITGSNAGTQLEKLSTGFSVRCIKDQ